MLFARAFESLFGAQFPTFASQFHGIVASFLVLVWFWPLIAKGARRLFNFKPDIEWIRLWRCPDCSNFNRSATSSCMHCQYHLQQGVLARHVPLWLSEGVRRGHKRFLKAYRAIGWVLFYSITVFAAWSLRLHQLKQPPAPEMVSCIAILVLLAAMLFFYRAFRPRFKSPVSLVMDSIAGIAATGFFIFLVAVWIGVQPKDSAPMMFVYNAQGQVRVRLPGTNVKPFAIPAAGKSAKMDVNYSVFSWPLTGIRNFTLLRVAGKPVQSRTRLNIYESFASPLEHHSFIRPRLTLFTQTFSVPANEPLGIYHDSGNGLHLEKTH
jgi:hypothetical protein